MGAKASLQLATRARTEADCGPVICRLSSAVTLNVTDVCPAGAMTNGGTESLVSSDTLNPIKTFRGEAFARTTFASDELPSVMLAGIHNPRVPASLSSIKIVAETPI